METEQERYLEIMNNPEFRILLFNEKLLEEVLKKITQTQLNYTHENKLRRSLVAVFSMKSKADLKK